MFNIIEVQARPGYKLWLRYSDGVAGEVDLSEYVGKGVFKIWNEYKKFENVTIGEDGGLTWGDEINICPDSLYLRITGKSPEEVFPNLAEMSCRQAWREARAGETHPVSELWDDTDAARKADWANMSLSSAMRGMEYEESPPYSEADLKEKFR